MGRAKKQQTIEATLGRRRIEITVREKPRKRSSPSKQSTLPTSTRKSARLGSGAFARASQRRAASSDSESESGSDSESESGSATQSGSDSESSVSKEDMSEEDVKPRASASARKKSPVKLSKITTKETPKKVKAEETDEEEESLVTPRSARRGVKRKTLLDDSDSDDLPLTTPMKRRRLVRRKDSSPAPAPTATVELESDEEEEEPRRPASARKAHRPRTEKERARELLRRKRAGETIEELEETSEDEEEDRKPLYDTDDDQALHNFEDDEEGIPEPVTQSQNGKKRKDKKRKKSKKEDDSDNSLFDDKDDDLDDFIDDDGPIGVPDEVFQEIPLQFTGHSHRPLKDHFRDVVEWIVQYRLNPAFTEKRHDIYRIAWGRLDDEVTGLANSKFSSSIWKADFILALRARPTITSEAAAVEVQQCGACGRGNHPAKFTIKFSGQPYYKSFKSETFLEPVEVDSDSEDDDSSKEGDYDEDGSVIAPADKVWYVGSVCHSNAETAHGLFHWKRGLLEWVDGKLEDEGLMSAGQLKAREKFTPKKRYKFANKTIERWVDVGIVKELYGAFSRFIEEARNKSTAGRWGAK